MADRLPYDILDRVLGYLIEACAKGTSSNGSTWEALAHSSSALHARDRKNNKHAGDPAEWSKVFDHFDDRNKPILALTRGKTRGDQLMPTTTSYGASTNNETLLEGTSAMGSLCSAARVNKHWLPVARRRLYKRIHVFDWDAAVLLSETLAYVNPKLASLVTDIHFFRDAYTTPVGLGVPITRILDRLTELKYACLDQVHVDIESPLQSLKKLQSVSFNGKTFYRRARVTAYCRKHCDSGIVHRVKCDCNVCKAYVDSFVNPGNALSKMPNATRVRMTSVEIGMDTLASPIGDLVSRMDPMPPIHALHLAHSTFARKWISPFFSSIAATLQHLQLHFVRFHTTSQVSYEDAGIVEILQIVGPRLLTFHCYTTRSIGSTAFRLLERAEDLRFIVQSGELHSDVVTSLPQTTRRLYINAPKSQEFYQLLLEKLQVTDYLPCLDRTPFIKTTGNGGSMGIHAPDLAASVTAARTRLKEDRGLDASGISAYVGTLLHPGPYKDHDDYYHPMDHNLHSYSESASTESSPRRFLLLAENKHGRRQPELG